jgi:hypothetical protein
MAVFFSQGQNRKFLPLPLPFPLPSSPLALFPSPFSFPFFFSFSLSPPPPHPISPANVPSYTSFPTIMTECTICCNEYVAGDGVPCSNTLCPKICAECFVTNYNTNRADPRCPFCREQYGPTRKKQKQRIKDLQSKQKSQQLLLQLCEWDKQHANADRVKLKRLQNEKGFIPNDVKNVRARLQKRAKDMDRQARECRDSISILERKLDQARHVTTIPQSCGNVFLDDHNGRLVCREIITIED